MGSYEKGKAEVLAYIKKSFKEGQTCLDVGACDGKWGKLLNGYLATDAVEIFKPNIEKHDLKSIYRRVFEGGIQDYEYEWYDLIIFGDVIEHLTVSDAQRVLKYAYTRCSDLIIAVPYLYTQGELYGNPWERHIQNDLTDKLFNERYPGFEHLLPIESDYAYYHKQGIANMA